MGIAREPPQEERYAVGETGQKLGYGCRQSCNARAGEVEIRSAIRIAIPGLGACGRKRRESRGRYLYCRICAAADLKGTFR